MAAAIVFVGQTALKMRNGLVKMTNLVRAISSGHRRDGTELGMEGWAEIDRVVA